MNPIFCLMKKVLILFALLLLGAGVASAQTVYVTSTKSDAHVKVYVTQTKSEADLVVYKCDTKSDAFGNKGLWYYVSSSSEAKKKIYITTTKSESDLVIYFTRTKSEAGWQNRSKSSKME